MPAQKYAIEYIRTWAIEKGFELVSNEYNGTNVKHDFRCIKHDKIHSAQPRQLLYGKHGLKCCGSEKLGGKNHYAWNPNLTDSERGQQRSASRNNKWVKDVRKRFKRICQVCDKKRLKAYDCIAHHIESYSLNKELRFEISNGTCLCEKCHSKFHKKYGYGNNTRLQLDEFKETYVKAVA